MLVSYPAYQIIYLVTRCIKGHFMLVGHRKDALSEPEHDYLRTTERNKPQFLLEEPL